MNLSPRIARETVTITTRTITSINDNTGDATETSATAWTGPASVQPTPNRRRSELVALGVALSVQAYTVYLPGQALESPVGFQITRADGTVLTPITPARNHGAFHVVDCTAGR